MHSHDIRQFRKILNFVVGRYGGTVLSGVSIQSHRDGADSAGARNIGFQRVVHVNEFAGERVVIAGDKFRRAFKCVKPDLFEITLDFARPGGGAEPAVLAIPVSLIHSLWRTAAVILGLAIIGALVVSSSRRRAARRKAGAA